MASKARWWADDPQEQYWCEITDRDDLGADLKCPKTNEAGGPYWSYDLIHEVRPGEIVFHYSTSKMRAFVGASIAGGPLEDREIIWSAHGTVGRKKQNESKTPRPGWRLPLHGFTAAPAPLLLQSLNRPDEQVWIRDWVAARGDGAMAPLQMYKGALRGAQAYLAKMPADWVERWPELSSLVDSLADSQDEIANQAENSPPSGQHLPGGGFNPKSAADYIAHISAHRQVKTRHHERLVKLAGERFQAAGAIVSNPHPIDLLMTSPSLVIFEAKTVGLRDPIFAVRSAVGQLLEYRHYIGPKDAQPCILLDKPPTAHVIDYVEGTLGMLIAWLDGSDLLAGPLTVSHLPNAKADLGA